MIDDGLVHWSTLKHIGKSPAHYRHALANGVKETPAMVLGTSVHQLVLGGPNAPVVYDGERRGNAWKDFKAANDGKTIVTAKEHELARAIADAVLSDPLSRESLDGAREMPIEWEIAGRGCAGRVDVYNEGALMLSELKTCADANPDRFVWQARRMGYFGQLAWYSDALATLGYKAPTSRRIVAVETKAPFAVTVFEVGESTIDMGRKQYRLLFERLRACELSNEWPAYSQCLVPLDMPEPDDFELDFGDSEQEAA